MSSVENVVDRFKMMIAQYFGADNIKHRTPQNDELMLYAVTAFCDRCVLVRQLNTATQRANRLDVESKRATEVARCAVADLRKERAE